MVNRNGFERWISSPTVGADGTIYICLSAQSESAFSYYLFSLDGKTGVEKFNTRMRSGHDSAENIIPGFHVQPVIGPSGTIFLAGLPILALDGTDGTIIWEADHQAYSLLGLAVVGANEMLWSCRDNDRSIYVTDWRNSGQRNEFVTKTGPNGPPVVGADGNVYLGTGSKFFALNGTKTSILGKLKPVWTFDSEKDGRNWQTCSFRGAPAIGPDRTIYALVDGGLYALDHKTGAKKWFFSMELTPRYNRFNSPAIGLDGNVYFGDSSGTIHAVNGQHGTPQWRVDFEGEECSRPAVGNNGSIYVAYDSCPGTSYKTIDDEYSRHLCALDGRTGTKKWEFKMPATRSSSSNPAIGIDGTVYAAAHDHLYALDSETGSLIWKVEFQTRKIQGSWHEIHSVISLEHTEDIAVSRKIPDVCQMFAPPPPPPPPPPQAPSNEPVENERTEALIQLKKLKAAHEDGILTDQEFAIKSQRYIDKL
jgi:outer membrane protein assembly factor BamB